MNHEQPLFDPSDTPGAAGGAGASGASGAAGAMESSTRSSSSPQTRRKSRHRYRNRSAMASHSLHFGPNMTPMVDVVMVILVFFMASAAFLGSEWFLRAAIPFQAGRGRDATKPNDPLELPPTRVDVVLDVDPASGITLVTFLRFTKVSIEEFERQISSMPREGATTQIEIVFRPSPRVPYRDVVRAHAACDAQGIFKVGYAPPTGP